jgi:DNA-binding NtrC family response regulator
MRNERRRYRRLLLIEDDVDIVASLVHRLTTLGYDIEAASTLHDAVKRVTRAVFDVILLDLTLPDGVGSDFLSYVKQQRLAVPVIAMSP